LGSLSTVGMGKLSISNMYPAIRTIAGDMFVFQQDNAPAHRARDTVELLRHETPQFISPDSWHVASQQSGRLPRLGHAARARVSSTNPQYGRVAEASCCDMGWISAQRGGLCSIQWRKRLEACIRAEGSQFEHLLWCCLPDIPVFTLHNRFFSEPPMFGGMQHYLQSDEKVLHFTR